MDSFLLMKPPWQYKTMDHNMLALVSREDNNSLILGWTMVGGHTDIAMHIQNAEPVTDNIIFSVIYDIYHTENMHTTLRHYYTVPTV